MNKIFDNKQEFTELYRDAVMSISGKSVEAASDLDRFNALAKLVAEKARTVATKSDARVTAEGKKRVYYFSIEFLIGRLLDNYLLNFGVRDMVAEALDDMVTHGYPWEVRRQDKAVTIKFGGHVEGFEENDRTFYRTVDTQDILAVPYDIPVVGYAAEPVEEHFDLEAFNRGDYALADAERAEAEAISAILYPNDAGEHGRLLRLAHAHPHR